MLKSEEEQEFQDMQDRQASDTHRAFRKYRQGGREYAAQAHKPIENCSCPQCVQAFPKPAVPNPAVPANGTPMVAMSDTQLEKLLSGRAPNAEAEAEQPAKRGPGRPPKNTAVESHPKENNDAA